MLKLRVGITHKILLLTIGTSVVLLGLFSLVVYASDGAGYISALRESVWKGIVVAVVVLGVVAGATVLLVKNIVSGITAANSALDDLSSGHLGVRLKATRRDELGEFSNKFNHFVEMIEGTVGHIKSSSSELGAANQDLVQYSMQVSDMVGRQRGETEQVATAINEMAATVQQVAGSANEAAQAADQADKEAAQGSKVVAETVSAIRSLSEEVESSSQVISRLKDESENIGSVLDVIKGIAEQTNLLALNAAIEAARAGEQGRGFAVVADEVRTLAQKTQESTQEIEQMIGALQQGANEAEAVMTKSREGAHKTVEQAGNASDSLDAITKSVATIRDMNTQIASAAEEQSAVASEVNRNITNIQHLSEESATSAGSMLDGCSQASDIGGKIEAAVNVFKA